MKVQFMFNSLLLLLISFLSSLNAGDMQTGELGGQKPSNNILIALYHTTFKDSVVSIIADSLTKEGYSITTIDFKDLDTDTIHNFHLVVMITWRRAFRLSLRARKVLRKLKEKKKVIMLVTALQEEWEYGDSLIDAMTCASQIEEADAIAKEVMKKIRAQVDDENTSE